MFAWAFEIGVALFCLWALATQVAIPTWRGTALWPAFSGRAARERRIADEHERVAQRAREADLAREVEKFRRESVGNTAADRRRSQFRRVDKESAE